MLMFVMLLISQPHLYILFVLNHGQDWLIGSKAYTHDIKFNLIIPR